MFSREMEQERVMETYFSFRTSEDHSSNKDDRSYYEQVYRHFSALRDMDLNYYGADSGEQEFKVDDIVFKVLEDPDDGYRSCLGCIDYGEQSRGIFFRKPLAKVRIKSFDLTETNTSPAYAYSDASPATQTSVGYRLVDVRDGHIWLEFGTDHADDYYPYFIFRHYPKEPE